MPVVAASIDLADGDVNIESAALTLAVTLHPDLAPVQPHDRAGD